MNTDELRHLLEMAARACGAQIEPCVCSSQPFRFKSTGGHWSPHVDDGTSARMRTALRMNVLWSDTAVHCLNSMGEAFESFADHNNDRDAALRLCALRVAAMIGENMNEDRDAFTVEMHDLPAGVQGLIQLGRNAIDRVSELERGIAYRDQMIRQLSEELDDLIKTDNETIRSLFAEQAKRDETIRQLRAEASKWAKTEWEAAK